MTTAKTAKMEVFIGLPRENCHLVFSEGGGGVNMWWGVYRGRFLQVGR